jgi:hypothetical protein
MLKPEQREQLAQLKSFIRAKAIADAPKTRATKTPRVTRTEHVVNHDSILAQYPPKSLTSYNIDYNAIIACGMVAGGKPKRHDTFYYGKRGRKV